MNQASNPQIQKARRVCGKSLVFRNAGKADAEFILSLRTNSEKARYLSQTSSDLQLQTAWLEEYRHKNDQAYFIIENREHQSLGTVRLYDAQDQSFCWGSWILKDGSPQFAAIESALMVYAYAIDHLGFHAAHFDVRKGNENVWRFHERFGATRVAELEYDYLYSISFDEISSACLRYKKYLPSPVIVDR